MRLLKFILIVLLFTIFMSGCGQASPKEENGETAGEPVLDVSEQEEEEEQEIDETPPAAEEITPIEYPQFTTDVQPDERIVKMVTNKGEITIKLFPKYAPLAVENFLTHSENGYYDGVIFHRVIENFMVQSGDPEGTGMGGESAFGEPFADEFSPSLAHFRGALSMANPGRPNMNGSQFFIVQSEAVTGDENIQAFDNYLERLDISQETKELYLQNGGTPHLDFMHTVFGHVIEGMDVVDEIARVETGASDRPLEDIIIERVEIVN